MNPVNEYAFHSLKWNAAGKTHSQAKGNPMCYLSPLSRFICVFLIIASVTGCSSIAPKQSAAFNQTVEGARVSLQASLDGIESVISEGQLETALRKDSRRLVEADFAPVIPAKTQEALIAQFDVLVNYSRALRSITDKKYQGAFASSFAQLNGAATRALTNANTLTETGLVDSETLDGIKSGLKIFSGISAAVGEAALNIYAQSKTLKIVKSNDAAITDYCLSLQQILSPSGDLDKSTESIGLVAITRQAYRQLKSSTATYFEALDKRPEAMNEIEWNTYRKSVAKQYAELVSAETKAKMRVLALRAAIGRIAEAHHALVEQNDRAFFDNVDTAAEYIKLITQSYNTGRKPQ